MRRGLHAPNQALPVSEGDPLTGLLRLAGPCSVKLLDIAGCRHSPADAGRLRSWGVPGAVVRLADWAPGFPFQAPGDHALELAGSARRWYAAGVRVFQVWNEPNWSWLRAPFGPWQFQYYARLAADELRRALPPDVVLVSPPLSWSPALWRLGPDNPGDFVLDDWLAAFRWIGGDGRSLYDYFDLAGANVYWQYPNQLADPSYGRSYLKVAADSGKRPVALEWGASNHLVPGWSPARVEAQRVAEYPQWLARAAAEGVDSAFAFIWGGTPDWAGFRLTAATCAAIA